MTFMFEVGKEYSTQGGEKVTVLGRDGPTGYECLLCSDGLYRYDRSNHSVDAGRVTGTALDYSDAGNFARSDRIKPPATEINAELLAALKDVMAWVSNWDCEFKNDPDWPELEETYLAAIARAEGAKCHCDKKGIGRPGVTCGDCPRDYK